MPRLEPLADLDPGYTGPQDASATLLADCQQPHKENAADRSGNVSQLLNFDPANDLELVDEGQKLAHLLAEGYAQDFAEEFATQMQIIGRVQDPDQQASDLKDFVDGLESINPTDIHVTRDADGTPTNLFLNPESEIFVNESFGLLDKYSTNPQLDPTNNPASTPEQAAANATLHVNKNLADMEKSLAEDPSLDDATRQALLTMYGADFIADFNRRRLENNYLPDFIAHTDENGKVEIVYLEPDNEDSSKK